MHLIILQIIIECFLSEVSDPAKDDRCHRMGSVMADVRRMNKGQDQCMWDVKDLLHLRKYHFYNKLH